MALAGTGSILYTLSSRTGEYERFVVEYGTRIEKVVIHLRYLGTLAASLILHSDDNVWRLGVLLLSLCGAVVGVSTLSGSTALVTALGSTGTLGQYKDGVKTRRGSILLALGSIGALNVQLVLLVGGMLTVGVGLGCDAVVGAELTTAAVTACRRNEGAAGRGWYKARLSQGAEAGSTAVEGQEL